MFLVFLQLGHGRGQSKRGAPPTWREKGGSNPPRRSLSFSTSRLEKFLHGGRCYRMYFLSLSMHLSQIKGLVRKVEKKRK